MLYPRLTTCSECTDVPILLERIDCKLAKLGSSLYWNVSFMMNVPISAEVIIDLLNYKRILTFKQVNPDYCENYTIDNIASRVNVLIHK